MLVIARVEKVGSDSYDVKPYLKDRYGALRGGEGSEGSPSGWGAV